MLLNLKPQTLNLMIGIGFGVYGLIILLLTACCYYALSVSRHSEPAVGRAEESLCYSYA